MKFLTLLRHAKSSWKDASQSDFDRPLNERGNRDAPEMARRMTDAIGAPDKIVCSSAMRTRQTAACFTAAHGLEKEAVVFTEDLYLASAGTLLDCIQQTDATSVQHLMIIAHNPGLEVLGRQLHTDAPGQLPTCSMLHFALNQDSFEFSDSTDIDLRLYDFPKSQKA